MCRPPAKKIDWQAELPPELVPPPAEMDVNLLPQLDMVPFVDVQMLANSDTYSSDSMDAQDADSDDSVSPMAMTPTVMSEDSENENAAGSPVILSCLNDPKVVWPSDSELSESEEEKDSSSDMLSVDSESDNLEAPGGNNDDKGPDGFANPVVATIPGRAPRGRNMARRSRPFFGTKIKFCI
jgi:hypothetical protein